MFTMALMHKNVGKAEPQLQINYAHFRHSLHMILVETFRLSCHELLNWPKIYYYCCNNFPNLL
jgi:hypothetical protein